MTPDPWQQTLLASMAEKILVLCSRQAGKSTTTSALAVRTALTEAPALVLVLSPSERQSAEFMAKVKQFYDCLSRPRNLSGRVITVEEKLISDQIGVVPKTVRESALQLHLDNGSRIIGLPSSEGTIRGYSGVVLLIIDEASRIRDDLYHAVRPMLATTNGRLVALTTPFGKRGWFYKEWMEGRWDRIRVKVTDCPRISKGFLADEQRSLGPRWFNQEYMCSFEDAVGQLIPQQHIDAAVEAGNELEAIPFGGEG